MLGQVEGVKLFKGLILHYKQINYEYFLSFCNQYVNINIIIFIIYPKLKRQVQFQSKKMNGIRYEKYKMPADFDLAQLHARSCKIYEHMPDQEIARTNNKCGCCNQVIGSKPVSMCEYVSSLRRIGQEVPLFFNFITLMILLCLFVVFLKVGEYLFFCDQLCQIVRYDIENLWGANFSILLGFMNQENFEFMIEIIAYSVIILAIKIHLKTRKYKYRAFNIAIEKRSVQLFNLPKDCTVADIKKMFSQFHIEEVVFAYRVRQYHKYMMKIANLKKALRYLHQIRNQQNQNVRRLNQKLDQSKKYLEKLLTGIKGKKKRLSIAFVVFATPQERNRALKKHRYGAVSKIFHKLFVCCSRNAIRGQHVTVESAPAPDDIKWQNLQNPYFRTKAVRFSSFLICTTILLFGMVSEVIVFNTTNSNESSTGQFFSSLVIFFINFMIINFLEFATHKLEAHQSNTHLKLSLTRKITFFMFVNVSISPFLIMLYNRLVNQIPISSLFTTITLTIIVVSVGNFFKPLLTLLSVPRFLKWIQCLRQKSKGPISQLNQSQANELFQPLQFPIEVYYSLLHASLMMSFFYLGCFQFLIVIQLPSLLMLYFIAKWMLLRVCKQPRGLSLKLNNLAQSLMRFYVPLYWLGRNMILVTKLPDEEIYFSSILEKMVYHNVYQIVSTSVVGFMIICEIFVSKIAEKLTPKQGDLTQYFEYTNNRTYSEANLFFKIHEEGLSRHTIKIPKRNKDNEEDQSQQSIDLMRK